MEHLEKDLRAEDEAEYEEEAVDPRIQGELEKLNQSTDDINRCETELEDARQKFRSVLVEATVKLDELVKKIGKPVEESKPYWEARRLARQWLNPLAHIILFPSAVFICASSPNSPQSRVSSVMLCVNREINVSVATHYMRSQISNQQHPRERWKPQGGDSV
ncbi:hypothetical protein NQZ68_020083 [Dissostichus eleginoides]|nr:hypothetical protein NQZ68_020083 [Dissostichus eleginoides]